MEYSDLNHEQRLAYSHLRKIPELHEKLRYAARELYATRELATPASCDKVFSSDRFSPNDFRVALAVYLSQIADAFEILDNVGR